MQCNEKNLDYVIFDEVWKFVKLVLQKSGGYFFLLQTRIPIFKTNLLKMVLRSIFLMNAFLISFVNMQLLLISLGHLS